MTPAFVTHSGRLTAGKLSFKQIYNYGKNETISQPAAELQIQTEMSKVWNIFNIKMRIVTLDSVEKVGGFKGSRELSVLEERE